MVGSVDGSTIFADRRAHTVALRLYPLAVPRRNRACCAALAIAVLAALLRRRVRRRPRRAVVAAPPRPALRNWPEFGLNPQRSDATGRSTGITPPTSAACSCRPSRCPAPPTTRRSTCTRRSSRARATTWRSSPPTTASTLAIDADSGRILWRFMPPGIARLAGQRADHDGQPDRDRRLRLRHLAERARAQAVARRPAASSAAGRCAITPAPHTREADGVAERRRRRTCSRAPAATTATPPPTSAISWRSRSPTGHVAHVFNTLCANRTTIIDPPSCSASDSAILSRSGPVVEPGATARADRHRQRAPTTARRTSATA